ncbi:uncharacterized protein LOC144916881 isoform X1 [Branchiostoma floridae x Branchiostoma belcheri]
MCTYCFPDTGVVTSMTVHLRKNISAVSKVHRVRVSCCDLCGFTEKMFLSLLLFCALSSVTQGQAVAGENGGCSSNRDCGSTQCCHVNGSPLTGLYPIMDGTTISGTCGPRPQEGQVCSLMYVSDNCACEDGLRCWGGITGIQPISGTCRTPEYIQQQYDNNPFWFLIP